MEIDGFKSLQPYEGVMMMDDIFRPSLSEMDSVVEKAVRESGFTLHELEEQAQANKFETLSAKLAWMVVSAKRS